MRNLAFETLPKSELSKDDTYSERLSKIREWQERKKKKDIKLLSLNLNNYDGRDLIQKLESIDDKIEILKCKGNGLRELPPLPRTLTHLDARYNLFNHKEKKRIIIECYKKGIIVKI